MNYKKVANDSKGCGGIMRVTPITMNGCNGEDRRVRQVDMSDFYISKYLITQRLWVKVMGESPSSFKGEDRPVENAEWLKTYSDKNRLSFS